MEIIVCWFVLLMGIDCEKAESPEKDKFPETADLVQKFDLLMSRVAFLEDTVQQQTTKIASLERGQQVLNNQIMKLKRDNILLLQRMLEYKTDCNTNVIKYETKSIKHENSKTDFEFLIGDQNKKIDKTAELHRSDIKNIDAINVATHLTKTRNGNRRATNSMNVAFSALLDHHIDVGNGAIIKYNFFLTNEGNWYNHYTGMFTVPVTGVYLFTFTLNINQKSASVRTGSRGNRCWKYWQCQLAQAWKFFQHRYRSCNHRTVGVGWDVLLWLEHTLVRFIVSCQHIQWISSVFIT